MPDHVALRGHIVQCGPYGFTSLIEVLLPLDYKDVPVLREHCSKIVVTGVSLSSFLIVGKLELSPSLSPSLSMCWVYDPGGGVFIMSCCSYFTSIPGG